MKPFLRLFPGLIVGFLLIHSTLYGQVPGAINYQAIARDAGGNLLRNQVVSFRLSIIQGAPSGTSVYCETHLMTTNEFGLATLAIGGGTIVSGNFSTIIWGDGSYYLQTEMDPAGGSSWSLMGTSQFLSVPYAKYASTSGNALPPGQNPGDMLYWNGTQWAEIPVGSPGQFLRLSPSSVPTWSSDLNYATLTTTPVSSITGNSAISGGNITNDGDTVVTARGVCWNTSPNPTIADFKTTDGTGTGLFISNLTGLTENAVYYIRAYATNSVGTAYGNELSFTTAIPCGSSFTINHVAGTVAPVTKTVTYGTVTNVPGEASKCWITSNLGADHQAIAVSDATEASAGWYWQFNRQRGFKHDGTTRTPSTAWINNINESSDWTAENDPCTLEFSNGWRIPTSGEWTNVDASGGWTNWYVPWNSLLKMHASGYLFSSDGSLSARGSIGYYWSNTQKDPADGWGLTFFNGYCYISNDLKANSFALRCLKDN